MTETWSPLCLVAACDAKAAEWPMPLVVLGEDLSLTRGGLAVDLTDVYPQLALAVSRSAAGAAVLDRFQALLAEGGRSLEGLRHDLSPNEDLAGAMVAGLARALAVSQGRVVRQVRELAQMRALTERSLQHFERLEAFVWQTAKCERNPVLTLAPVEGRRLELSGAVEQRLPTDSVGLSDLAVWTAGGTGVLTVALQLMESAVTVAEWQIDAPSEGWQRLALPRALDSDAQTPVLRLSWAGEAALAVGLSLDHPDRRFQCQGGPMLALRLWKFIPGTHAPLSPDSLAPLGQPARGRWLIGLAALGEAAARADDPQHVELVDWAGLVLRPEPGQALSLCLPGLARPGLRRLQAMTFVEGLRARAELAFAVCAHGATPEPGAWQAMTAAEPDQLHLVLPIAPETPCDLWILARNPGEDPCKVTIERIEGFADPTGHDADV